jgi:hypothetical protein
LVPLVARGGKTTDVGLISWEAQKVVEEIRYPTQFPIYFFLRNKIREKSFLHPFPFPLPHSFK